MPNATKFRYTLDGGPNTPAGDGASNPGELPKIIGHRGCRAPGTFENTARAVSRALAEGADIVEVDVVKTKDGHFVALHWPDIHFLGLPPWKYRLRELPRVDPISAILEAVGRRAALYLDVKQPLERGEFLELAELVDRFQLPEVIVGSFHRRVLVACTIHRPTWIANYDCLPFHRAIQEAKDLGAQWINPIAFGIRKSFVDEAVAAGLKFVPAGNEDDKRQLRYAKWGAYALSTFRPARLRALLRGLLGSAAEHPATCHRFGPSEATREVPCGDDPPG
ncbi:MAG: glycerophosphodiester phosphodiesterase [Candidatus Binatia bacterium]|nr:glycerophosphodiester phosphodiesterase [Candidatus Binatia bacterium]